MVRYPSIPQDRRTTNGISGTYARSQAFALMYRRVNGTFYEIINIDGFVKSPKVVFFVIPAEAGIQSFQALLDSRLRGSDNCGDFLLTHQYSIIPFFSFMVDFVDGLRAAKTIYLQSLL
jgi:hypothetical protein